MVSHRSGETEDTFIADLVVGLCTGHKANALNLHVLHCSTCKFRHMCIHHSSLYMYNVGIACIYIHCKINS